MKLSWNITVFLLIIVLPINGHSLETKPYGGSGLKTKLMISQTGREKALEKRGVKVTRAKDDLIRKTVRAYGGDYTRNEDTAILTLQGKTYKNFTAQVVEGKYLLIKTPDDTFYLDLVDK